MNTRREPPPGSLITKTEIIDNNPGIPAWWGSLFREAPNASVFLSPAWVQTWLDLYAKDFSGIFVSWWIEDLCLGGSMLFSRKARQGPFPISRIVFNTADEIDENGPFIEYNDLLCRSGYEHVVAEAFASLLSSRKWDQLYLAGYADTSVIARLRNHKLPGSWDVIEKNSPYIDLESIGEGGYDQYLSSNARSQIRRSIKLYEERGPVKVTAATSIEECIEYLESLAELHRSLWQSRGEPGGFRSARFIQFHHGLARRLWDERGIEVLKVTAGNDVIGYLYNYLYNNRVFFYQSGFIYDENSKIKPGLVSHYLAISDYLRRGFKDYDFGAGESQYKRTLAKSSRKLCWATIDRSNMRMQIVKLAKDLYHRLRARHARASALE